MHLVKAANNYLNSKDSDYKDELNSAKENLVAAFQVYTLSKILFLTSLISCVTRPLATLVEGPKSSDKNRFFDSESISGQLLQLSNSFIRV